MADQVRLAETAVQSKIKNTAEYKNPKGEYFLYEDGSLSEYTDTRVINHDDDRLVDLSTQPFTD